MNKPNALLFAAIALAAAIFGRIAAADDVTDLLTSGPWQFTGSGWTSERVFNKDGTFFTKDKPGETGRWRIGATAVELTFNDGHKNTITLPLKPSGTTGADRTGKPVVVVLDLPAPAAGAQASAAGPAKPAGNALAEIDDRAAWTTEGVFAPLNAKLPSWEKSPKLRADITALRVRLLDEAAKAPSASPDTYKVAVDLCDAWLAALTERDRYGGGQSGQLAATDMQTSKPVVNEQKLTPEQLEQERLDEQKTKQLQAKQNAFFNDAQNKDWMQRVDKLRPGIEQLLAQLGESLRAGTQPKPSASPAGS